MGRRRAAVAGCSVLIVVASACAGQDGAGARPLGETASVEVAQTQLPPPEGVPVDAAAKQPPPPASAFRARAVAGGVELTWIASPDVRYRVLREAPSGPAKELTRVAVRRPGAVRYVDRTARTGTRYRYRIVPQNLWGLDGAASATVTLRAR